MKLVSVIIPCRNEVQSVGKCIEAILASDYPLLEIIVVDGMSEDGTRSVLNNLSKSFSNIKIVDNPEKLTPFAFNYGVKNANGFYIQRVDARNLIAVDYISKLVNILEENPMISCVGGDYQHTYSTPAGEYISWAMESKFGVGAGNYRTMKKNTYVDTVGVPMYRRSIFEEIGFFDENLARNQDDDFNFRVRKKGHKILYVCDAKVKYFVRGTYKKLFNQMKQYGYFKVFVNKKHKTVTTIRQIIPLLFLIFSLGGALASFLWPLFFPFYLLIMAAYFLLGSVSATAFTINPFKILNVQYACLVMHLGYGLGYLIGILDFLILNKSPSNFMKQQTT